jgi:hypothetical protein
MESKIQVGPPPKPNRKEFPFVGTIAFRGLKICVENKKGDIREGVDKSGKKWRTLMKAHYGEILGTRGVDKDKVDVYVGEDAGAKDVYVVHQNHPKDHPHKAGEYDEDKCILGVSSPAAAKKLYLSQYNDSSFFRSMTIMPFEQFVETIRKEKGEKIAMFKLSAQEAYELGIKVALAEIQKLAGGPAPVASMTGATPKPPPPQMSQGHLEGLAKNYGKPVQAVTPAQLKPKLTGTVPRARG